MAKLTKEELSAKIDGLEIDDDIKISLMEDISDSISPDESEELTALKDEIERTKEELIELKAKYKERFLKAVDSTEKEDEEKEELEEKEVIDVKEI